MGPETTSPAPAPGSTRIPAWLDVLAAVGWRALAAVAFALVMLAIAIELSTVTASIVVALIVAAVLAPAVRGLRDRGLAPTLAAAAACLAGVVVLAVVVAFLALALVPYLPDVIAAIETGIGDVRDQLVAVGAPDVVLRAFDQFVDALVGVISVDPAALLGPIASVGTVAILGGFLTFFLLQDGERGWAWLMQPLAGWRAETVTASARSGLQRVSGYIRRTATLAVIDAVAVAATLVLLGVPLAGPLVVLVFVGGFVPYLGAIVLGGFVVLATLAGVGAVAAGAVITVLLVTSVLGPRALERIGLGRAVDVHPVVVLSAITAGAALFGILGLVAVLPVTVFLLAVSRSLIVALDLEPAAPGASAPVRPGVPVWLDRLGQWSWRGLVVIAMLSVVVAAALRIPGVVLPGVIALVLAATISPLVARLRRRGWSPGLAAGVATAGAAAAVVAGLVVSIAWTIGPLQDIVDTSLAGATDTDLAWLRDLAAGIGSELTIDIAGLLRSLAGLGLAVLLALLLTLFFLRDGGAWWDRAMSRLRGRRRDAVDAVGHDAVEVLSGYMVGTAAISAFGGVTSALIMAILGLPLAIPVGILSFFGGFIPYIGSFVTTAMAFLIAVALGSTTDVVIMAGYTVVFNIVQGNFVTPLVYGRTLSLHPAIILLAIPAGNQVGGILGMFLVVPFVAVVSATWRRLLETIGPEPVATASDAVPRAAEDTSGLDASSPDPGPPAAPAVAGG
jgi:predicted PurR-regulated permease PerM